MNIHMRDILHKIFKSEKLHLDKEIVKEAQNATKKLTQNQNG